MSDLEDPSREPTNENRRISRSLRRLDGPRKVNGFHNSWPDHEWTVRSQRGKDAEGPQDSLSSAKWRCTHLLPPSAYDLDSIADTRQFSQFVNETRPRYVISTVPEISFGPAWCEWPSNETSDVNNPVSPQCECHTRLCEGSLCVWSIDWEGRQAQIHSLRHYDEALLRAMYLDQKRRFQMFQLGSGNETRSLLGVTTVDPTARLKNTRSPKTRRSVQPPKSAGSPPSSPIQTPMFLDSPLFRWHDLTIGDTPPESAVFATSTHWAKGLLPPFHQGAAPGKEETVKFNIWATDQITKYRDPGKPLLILCQVPSRHTFADLQDATPTIENGGVSQFCLVKRATELVESVNTVEVVMCHPENVPATSLQGWPYGNNALEKYWSDIQDTLKAHATPSHA